MRGDTRALGTTFPPEEKAQRLPGKSGEQEDAFVEKGRLSTSVLPDQEQLASVEFDEHLPGGQPGTLSSPVHDPGFRDPAKAPSG